MSAEYRPSGACRDPQATLHPQKPWVQAKAACAKLARPNALTMKINNPAVAAASRIQAVMSAS